MRAIELLLRDDARLLSHQRTALRIIDKVNKDTSHSLGIPRFHVYTKTISFNLCPKLFTARCIDHGLSRGQIVTDLGHDALGGLFHQRVDCYVALGKPCSHLAIRQIAMEHDLGTARMRCGLKIVAL